MPVYKVIISEPCRKQNRKLLDFVIQCDSDQTDVYSHYHKSYNGFCVEVHPVEVLNIENQPVKQQPEAQHPVTKTEKTSVLNIDSVKLTPDEVVELESILKEQNELSSKRYKFVENVKIRLEKMFTPIRSHYGVNVKLTYGDYPRIDVDSTWSLKAAIGINGSIVDHFESLSYKGDL